MYKINKREEFRKRDVILESNSFFKDVNFNVFVSGNVQKYNTTRRKIEVKKEIRDRFPVLNDNSKEIFYFMEHYAILDQLLHRVLEIKKETGELPLIMGFQKKKL
ncbi:hypothetical protein HY498_01950 [Candidatus Woesearchaeota archaeon]|nr:hypothetical protein [Candidatus Woesearchaeota archaeon]